MYPSNRIPSIVSANTPIGFSPTFKKKSHVVRHLLMTQDHGLQPFRRDNGDQSGMQIDDTKIDNPSIVVRASTKRCVDENNSQCQMPGDGPDDPQTDL